MHIDNKRRAKPEGIILSFAHEEKRDMHKPVKYAEKGLTVAANAWQFLNA